MHPIINQEHLTKYHRRNSTLGGDILFEMHPTTQEEAYKVERIVGHKKVGKKGSYIEYNGRAMDQRTIHMNQRSTSETHFRN
jgi:hypothetical protein